MILPYLIYCNLAWSNSTSTSLNKLLRLQKKIVRIITNSPYLAHTGAIFRELQLLKVHDIHKLQTAVFMFKIYHNLLPPHITSYFHRSRDSHSYPTRNSQDNFLICPRHTELRSKTIRFSGPKGWNVLTEETKKVHSLSRFKHIIITQILQSYY